MLNENQELKYHNNALVILAGMLVGSLIGAITALLFAPQSGEDTRTQIMEKGIELRDQTTNMADDIMSQIQSDGKKLNVFGRRKAKDLFKQGQALVVEQLDNVSDAAQAGKKAIQAS
jgi:gas vesicle protein